MATTPGARGARALGDDRRKGGAWWKWLLGLLLLAAVVVALVLLLSGGKDDKKSAAAPAAAPATGALTAGGRSLLGSPAQAVGTPAVGKAVKVLSVVEGEGFFVGTSAADRVYVEYGGAVGADEPAHDYRAVVGDAVDLTGPVRPAPQDPARTLKLGAQDARLVASEGAYVNATTVTKAG